IISQLRMSGSMNLRSRRLIPKPAIVTSATKYDQRWKRAKPQVRSWMRMYASSVKTRSPMNGRRKHTGSEKRMKKETIRSRMAPAPLPQLRAQVLDRVAQVLRDVLRVAGPGPRDEEDRKDERGAGQADDRAPRARDAPLAASEDDADAAPDRPDHHAADVGDAAEAVAAELGDERDRQAEAQTEHEREADDEPRIGLGRLRAGVDGLRHLERIGERARQLLHLQELL